LNINVQEKYKNLLLIGTIIGMLGTIAVIIGLLLEFELFKDSLTTTKINALIITVFCLAIFIIELLTFLGILTPFGFRANDERPGLFGLFLFLYLPPITLTYTISPFSYLIQYSQVAIAAFVGFDVALGFDFFLLFIGVALLFISMVIHGLIFLIKQRWTKRLSEDLSLSGQEKPTFVKGLTFATAFFMIISSIAMILGVALPPYEGTDMKGLLFTLSNNYLDLGVMFFILEMVTILIVALVVILSNLGIFGEPLSTTPLLGFASLPLLMPSVVLASYSLNTISSTIVDLFNFIGNNIGTGLTAFGWILFIGALLFLLAFMIGVAGAFYFRSASAVERPARRRSRTSGPTSPPSASLDEMTNDVVSGPPSSSGPPSLASQLGSSGPPSGKEPTVTSEPPQPPSFMPSTGEGQSQAPSGPPSAAQETPTCPFCGKPLRFIDQYQRWYCDNCQQYV
jgi:hypothetical protein